MAIQSIEFGRLSRALALCIVALTLACSDDTNEPPAPMDERDMATGDMTEETVDMAADLREETDAQDLDDTDMGDDMSCAPDCIVGCDYLDESEGVCGNAMTDVDGVCQAPGSYEDTESSCDDGLDNDCDGETDCGGDCAPCDVGDFRWATSISTSSISTIRALETITDGVIVGFRYLSDDVDLGDGQLPHAGSVDVGLAKFDTSGNHVFSIGMGGTASDRIRDVAVDSSGNIYMVGNFEGTSSFGGSPVTAGGTDIFVAKFDPNGTHLWSQNVGGTADENANNIEVTSNDEILIAGSLENVVDLGGGDIGSSEGAVFVARYDADGNHLFSKAWEDTGDLAFPFGLDLDASDNIYMTGYFLGTIDFGGGTLMSADRNGAFLVKLDADANHLWSTSFGGGAVGAEGNDVAVTPSGESYFSIFFSGTIEAAGNVFTSSDDETGFLLVKLDSAGNALWSSTDGGRDLAVDAEGNVFSTDTFTANLNLGGETLTADDGGDFYVAKTAPDGTPLWTYSAGGQGDEVALRIAVTGEGVSYIGGDYSSSLDFDSGMLTSTGPDNGFLLSLTR